MHVSMVTARYPPLLGGTEQHVAEVSRRLVARGHQVTVFTTVAGQESVERSDECGVTVVRIPARRLWNDVAVPVGLTKLVAQSGCDIVHVQGYHTLTAPMAMAASRKARRPYVVTFHSGGHDSRIRRALRPLQRELLRRPLLSARRLIAVSDFERRFFESALRAERESIAVIPTGVSPEFAAAVRGEWQPLLVSVGRLTEYKGHHLVIDALSEIRRQVPGARLMILGNGGDREALLHRAESLGVAHAVDVTSVPPHERAGLAQRLADSAVAVFMSSYESQGIAGLEAIAAGARLVIARGTALEDLVFYDGVELVDRGDSDGLVAAVVGALLDGPLAHRSQVLTLEDTTDHIEAVYLEAIAESIE